MSAPSALTRDMAPTGSREAVRALWRAEEPERVSALLSHAEVDESSAAAAQGLALELARRLAGTGGAARHDLLAQLALGSMAGRALLSLAEALLRTCNRDDADRLIRDQLARVRADPRGLAPLLAAALRLGAVVVDARVPPRSPRPWARAAAPLVRRMVRGAMGVLGGRFVFAPDIGAALRRAARRGSTGERFSFDMLGEAALTAADAARYESAYERAIRAVGAANAGLSAAAAHGISVKLSALHPRYAATQRARLMRELLPRLQRLATLACREQVPLTIDAEESERLELSLDLLEGVLVEPALHSWSGLGLAVQAYQRRAPALLDYLRVLAQRRACPLRVRLVKGAYWDLEIKNAQLDGLTDFPVYTRRAYTDVAFLACTRQLLHSSGWLAPQFATHNARSVADVLTMAADADVPYEFQRLHGMGEALYRTLAELRGARDPLRIYAPVGDTTALLPYLMRRLLENGASSSFVHRAAHASAAELAADPRALALAHRGRPHPHIAPPCELFAPLRRNSAGRDLTDPAQWSLLAAALAQSRSALLEIHPAIAGTGEFPASRAIRSPADRSELIGHVHEVDEAGIERALQAAEREAGHWAASPIGLRAAILERAADLFQQHDAALVARIVREAGRTVADALAEVREAVDALRYYAAQIRTQLDPAGSLPLGPVVCISPWNFPLAIFTGQIAAALAAGNVVLAKPAEQTAATASLAVELLHAAGMSAAVIQLLPGEGARVGMRLVRDERVRGVIFTGSTQTARAIGRILAARGPVPLIAETGGQNAMIVDSTALPEQVVADVLRSAFNSAGQRCSSLRVLCLQREIAPAVLAMLEGAMRELIVGDPAEFATDIGPLIDEAARGRIERYLAGRQQRVRCRTPLAPICERGTFLAPTLLQIESLEELEAEVFGPVLHVLCYEGRALDRLLSQLNATGYGLTLGIASRIESTIEHIRDGARVGNVYVNRTMIGAVIGAQPFGGEGLSGTGPKAGGPLYLQAMLARRTGIPLAELVRPPAPGVLTELIEWLQPQPPLLSAAACERLRRRARQYAERSLWGLHVLLPAAAGERNELRFRDRGCLMASARSAAALIEQLCAAIATGNSIWSAETSLGERLRDELPRSLAARIGTAREQPHGAATCRALLVDAEDAAAAPEWLAAQRAALAARDGPLVPLILADPLEGYDLLRLISEQAVSTNTAALGGDAALLDLADDADDADEQGQPIRGPSAVSQARE